jgi:hypothetical protein
LLDDLLTAVGEKVSRVRVQVPRVACGHMLGGKKAVRGQSWSGQTA